MVTNDSVIASNVYKIRNHGEVVNSNKKFPNLIGYNFRLNEIEAAIAIEQLKKLKKILYKKIRMANLLTKYLKKFPGLKTPLVSKNNTHVYYSYPLQIDEKITRVKKKIIFSMLKKEGVPINNKYVNLLEYKIYNSKNLKNFYPWSISSKKNFYKKKSNVYKQIKKINESIHLDIPFCTNDFSKNDIIFIKNCFIKVWKNLKLL